MREVIQKVSLLRKIPNNIWGNESDEKYQSHKIQSQISRKYVHIFEI